MRFSFVFFLVYLCARIGGAHSLKYLIAPKLLMPDLLDDDYLRKNTCSEVGTLEFEDKDFVIVILPALLFERKLLLREW